MKRFSTSEFRLLLAIPAILASLLLGPVLGWGQQTQGMSPAADSVKLASSPGSDSVKSVNSKDSIAELEIEANSLLEEAHFDKLPQPLKTAEASYPDSARKSGAGGTVWVRALIDRQGNVVKAVIQKSDQPILNESAIAAAMKYEFSPAIHKETHVAVWAIIPFRFKLNR